MKEQAYTAGLAYGVGFILARRLKSLAEDANTNNPYWVTTENGHHFLIDEEGIIQRGRFKGKPIDRLKNSWRKSSNQNNQKSRPAFALSRSERKSRKKHIDKFKYSLKTPPKALEYIRSLTLEPRNKETLRKHRQEFNATLDRALSLQPAHIKEAVERFKLNPEGVTEIPITSERIKKLLNLNPTKKVVMTLFQQKRALGKHDNMDEAGLRKALGLCFMGENLEITRLKANSDNYSRLGVEIRNNTFGDVVIDIAEKNRHYEVVHFFKTDRKSVEKGKL